MNLTLIAFYLDQSQSEYIIAIRTAILQENFNFNFEYYDSQSELVNFYNIKTFPSFALLKDNRLVEIIIGKLNYSELKERLLSLTYVQQN